MVRICNCAVRGSQLLIDSGKKLSPSWPSFLAVTSRLKFSSWVSEQGQRLPGPVLIGLRLLTERARLTLVRRAGCAVGLASSIKAPGRAVVLMPWM